MGYTVGIVGGGAAGMMAAVTAAGLGAKVVLFEKNDRLGKKILSTGNGKCNLGNEKLDAGEYYTESPDFLRKCLERFGTRNTVDFFQGIGLMIKSKNGGLYPVCEQASAVLDVLRHAVRAAGVEVAAGCGVEKIEKDRKTGRFRIRGNGDIFTFDRIILACGGKAAPKTGSDGSGYILAGQLGHSLVPVVPALVQLRCGEEYFRSVSGVRADAELSVLRGGKCAARERGELQLTDYGISGIPVFQLSRVVNRMLAERPAGAGTGAAGGSSAPGKSVEIAIDLLPDYSREDFEALINRRKHLRQRSVEEFFTGMLHKKLMMLFIKLAGLKPAESIDTADEEKVMRVYRLCRDWRVHVTGNNGYDNAQVCAGGVPLWEVTEELESRKTPGAYFAGELLDVDGRCGGYNLQWAWCSGYLAGRGAAGGGMSV